MAKDEMKIEEWYVILNMNCKYEICRMCPKSGLFKGTYEECEKWIEQKQKEEMKDELQTWKKASENNSYKAFQFEKENKELKSWKCKAETYMNYLIGLAQGSGLEKDNLVLEAEQFLNSKVEK